MKSTWQCGGKLRSCKNKCRANIPDVKAICSQKRWRPDLPLARLTSKNYKFSLSLHNRYNNFIIINAYRTSVSCYTAFFVNRFREFPRFFMRPCIPEGCLLFELQRIVRGVLTPRKVAVVGFVCKLIEQVVLRLSVISYLYITLFITIYFVVRIVSDDVPIVRDC